MNRFTVGEATIHRIEEMTAPMPLAMFGEDLVARNADWLYPQWANPDGTWDMVVQSWIVVVDGRVVVIDPCVGNGRQLPHFALFDNLDTPFIERFAATGIRPEDVDHVFCTHLHSDHCGWNTSLRDGRFVPTFPNARYLLAQRELDRWNPDLPGYQHVPENAGIFAASVQPVIEAGLVDAVGENHRISPSLETRPAYGHTLGHSVVHLASAGEEAWFTGDVFHHPIELIHPEIDAGTCDDFAQTLVTRRRLIDRFVATGALVIPAHFVAPHVGHLREVDGRPVFTAYGQ
ncbi:MBL fold metallo-hydrolase [Novosphingobium sp. JCM 18896]|uniref:MBL fold metallo-hydrolase n=1 Tax=Novosphingobium sp. JCM 18896 TaxID=2989731 RepID=UPI0022236481|nr:MBL fold metallo-hydrolase [Novosphingobium sp. JCM 18896]MCW1428674.1 MBL fold metallo-hydrolase [Novosphingobium sp. JCM 18896]